eukprot:517805_1
MDNDEKYAYSEDELYEEEAIVSKKGDCRIPVYASTVAKQSIIECIGQLVMVYKYDDKTRNYSITINGTGTVYHIDTNKNGYIITCAHNVRRKIKECTDCGNWMEKKIKRQNMNMCTRCKGMNLKQKIIPANRIQFNRRSIKNDYWIETNGTKIEIKYGSLQQAYKAKCHYIDDDNYNKYSFTNQGYDIAILSFVDCDNYYKQYCKDICIRNGKDTIDGNIDSFFMFGYPAYPTEIDKHGKMKGMESTGEHFEVKIAKQTCKWYLKQQVIDASPGQSGSCLFYINETNNTNTVIFGVHTGGNQQKK